MTPHDLYLTQTIDTIGRERTIIALQHSAAQFYRFARLLADDKHGLFPNAANHQHAAAWYSRQARILMGIE